MQTDWHMAVSACAFLLEHLPRVGEAMGECEAVFLAAERVAGGRTRVSLCAEIKATRLVPGQVVDYVATRALDRAVAWVPRARSSR